MPLTINVSTSAELTAALAAAKGGETIVLAGGDYGKLQLINGRLGVDVTFPSNVTITSADPSDPAVFSRVDIRGATNLTFDGVTFDYTFQSGDTTQWKPFSFSECDNLTIRNSVFDGDVASGVSSVLDGFGTATGLSLSKTHNMTLENNEFSGFHRGLVVGASDDVVVRGNEIYDMRSEGMNIIATQGILIEDNYIHDFRRAPGSGDHADMIQFWTNGSNRPSTDVMIRGNVLISPEGTATQSIFMRNEAVDMGQGGDEMLYRNITVEHNTIVNGHKAGVTIGHAAGVTVQYNTVLSNAETPTNNQIPLINVKGLSTDVTIGHNTVHKISGYSGQTDWNVGTNSLSYVVKDVLVAPVATAPMVAEVPASEPQPAPTTTNTAPTNTAPTNTAPSSGTSTNTPDKLPVASVELLSGFLDIAQEKGAHIAKTGVSHRIDRDQVAPLITGDAFSIDFALKADAANSWGEVFRLHSTITASVTRNGDLVLYLSPDDAAGFKLRAGGSHINDGATHDISIVHGDGRVQIWVDGAMAAETALPGHLNDSHGQDFLLGNPWGGRNFAGTISDLAISTEAPRIAVDNSIADDGTIVSYDSAHGLLAYENGTGFALPASGDFSAAGLDLGDGTVARVGREHVYDILGDHSFAIGLTLDADTLGSSGEVFRIHQGMIATVDKGGEFVVQAFLADGTRLTLSTDGAGLGDSAAHEITIRHADDTLELWVDGNMLGQTAMTSPLADKGDHGLIFGNPWGHDNFDGHMTSFAISTEVDAPDGNDIWAQGIIDDPLVPLV